MSYTFVEAALQAARSGRYSNASILDVGRQIEISRLDLVCLLLLTCDNR
jgi:hypothetical protein